MMISKIFASSMLPFLMVGAMALPGGTRGPRSEEGGVFGSEGGPSFGGGEGPMEDHPFEGEWEGTPGAGAGHGPKDKGDRAERFFKMLGLGYLGRNHDGFVHGDFITNITCSEVEDEPLCPLPPTMDGGERNGTWVCRSVHHPITGILRNSSACINPDFALETDNCGCCEGNCPELCECGCNEENGKGGVLVEGPSVVAPGEMVQICMPPAAAMSLVDAIDVVQCVTTCPE